MNKLKSITSFEAMSSADFEKLMGTNTEAERSHDQTGHNEMCPYCNDDCSIIQDPFEGIVVCKNCGQVIDIGTFDHAPEWKTFDDNCSIGRCGMQTNSLLPQSSMSTSIRGACNQRLKTMQMWSSMPPKERSLNNDLKIITEKCKLLNMRGYIEDTAKQYYKIATDHTNETKEKTVIRGKNRDGLMAACIFYACKKGRKIISLKEIAQLFQIKTTSVNKGCKIFNKYVKYMKVDFGTNLSFPSSYIKQYCDKLKLSTDIMDFCTHIAKYIETHNLIASHTPVSIASVCILYGVMKKLPNNCHDHISIANLFDISEATVTKTFRELLKYEGLFQNSDEVIVVDKHKHCEIPDSLKLQKRIQSSQKLTLELFNNDIVMPVENFLSYSKNDYMKECAKGCLEECKKYADYTDLLLI